MNTPYTYLIGWSNHNVWYYGSRYAKGCSTKDLWVSYFTSSKYVMETKKLYGEPDVIQIRKTFETPQKAQEWEKKVLKRMNVLYENKWLNKNIGGRCYIEKQTQEHIEKRTKNKKHHPNQKDFALKASKIQAEKRKGQKDSEETKLKRANSLREYYKKNPNHRRSPKKKYFIEGKVYFGLNSIMKAYGFNKEGSVYYRIKSDKYPKWEKM